MIIIIINIVMTGKNPDSRWFHYQKRWKIESKQTKNVTDNTTLIMTNKGTISKKITSKPIIIVRNIIMNQVGDSIIRNVERWSLDK